MKTFYLSVFFVLLLVLLEKATAQYSDKVWCFGDSAGINFSDLQNISVFASSIDSRGTCANISDSIGNLLFYSGSSPNALQTVIAGKIYSNNNQIMQNGDSIVGRAWYYEHLIVPNPFGDNTFYLFTGGVTSY